MVRSMGPKRQALALLVGGVLWVLVWPSAATTVGLAEEWGWFIAQATLISGILTWWVSGIKRIRDRRRAAYAYGTFTSVVVFYEASQMVIGNMHMFHDAGTRIQTDAVSLIAILVPGSAVYWLHRRAYTLERK